MKRISIAVFALVACLAIVLVPAATAKKKKVKTFTPAVGLQVSVVEPTTPSDPYAQPTPGSGTFAGKVTSGGPTACSANRAVSITRVGGGLTISAKTNSNADYSASVAARPPAGTYTATVTKVVIKKKNKKTGKITKRICAAGTSPGVPVA
jgi:hypothetical protein